MVNQQNEKSSQTIFYFDIFSFAEDLGITHAGKPWHCSSWFLYWFCQWYAVVSKKITGEGLDCPDYSDFLENTWKPLLQEYKPNDIYNADETHFFLQGSH